MSSRPWGYWTRERIIEALQRDAERRGRPPSRSEWQRVDRRGRRPTGASVARRFGSWGAGLRAAGLQALPQGHHQLRTVCKAGLHPMVGDNVGPERVCLACRRINDRKKYARQRARARLEQGLCVVCGEEPARTGRLACGDCFAYLREAKRT